MSFAQVVSGEAGDLDLASNWHLDSNASNLDTAGNCCCVNNKARDLACNHGCNFPGVSITFVQRPYATLRSIKPSKNVESGCHVTLWIPNSKEEGELVEAVGGRHKCAGAVIPSEGWGSTGSYSIQAHSQLVW